MLHYWKGHILITLALAYVAPLHSQSMPIANHSFEAPVIDPNTNPFLAIPIVQDWIELDNDVENSANTGIFYNPPPGPGHITNADGKQLMFLGSEQGNAVLQDLEATYQMCKAYQLSAGVAVSGMFPPDPNDTLTLALYYIDGETRIDIDTTVVPRTELISTELVNFSVEIPAVLADDPWAGKNIGVAIRATGAAGGFWDVDNVALTQLLSPDFTHDGIVNYYDYAALASEWMDCGTPETDLNQDNCVNLDELAILAQCWLETD